MRKKKTLDFDEGKKAQDFRLGCFVDFFQILPAGSLLWYI